MFARPRVAAVFKKKAATKRGKGHKTGVAQVFEAARIQRIRQVQTGQRRVTSMRHNAATEYQLRQLTVV